jgi:hypothetical protein
VTALLFGASISATDPVSVLALFRKLGLPKRLNTIVEGESLINDGTAVVIFKILLAIAVGATLETSMGGLLVDSLSSKKSAFAITSSASEKLSWSNCCTKEFFPNRATARPAGS